MQLLFLLDQDMEVEKTLIQTLASQLSCDFCSRLTRTSELRKLSYKHSLVNSHQLSCNSCSHLIRTRELKKLSYKPSQLSLTLTQLKLKIFVDKNLVPYPTCLHSSFLLSLHGPQAVCTCAPMYTVLYWLTGPHTWFSSNWGLQIDTAGFMAGSRTQQWSGALQSSFLSQNVPENIKIIYISLHSE